MRSGFGAVVLEAKVDRALQDAAMRAAAARDVAFHLVSPSGPAGYDPLAHGSVDERSERLVAAESWGSADADFYRQAASPFLRLALRALERSERAGDARHRRSNAATQTSWATSRRQIEDADLVGEINGHDRRAARRRAPCRRRAARPPAQPRLLGLRPRLARPEQGRSLAL